MERLRRSKVFLETGEEPGKETPLKSRLPENLCHDLRSPLNVIIGFAELMLDEVPGKINAEQRQGLDDILGNARRLLHLINRIFELHGDEPGKEA